MQMNCNSNLVQTWGYLINTCKVCSTPRKGPAHRAEWVNSEHRYAGVLPTASGGQESLIPYSLLLSFLFTQRPATIVILLVSRSTFPYFIFFPHFLEFPVFLFCPALPLPKSSWACLLQVPPPAYFPTFLYSFLPCSSFFYCISLSRTSLRSPTSHVCPALSFPKSCWAGPLQVPPPMYFLPFPFTLPSRTSLYSGFYL